MGTIVRCMEPGEAALIRSLGARVRRLRLAGGLTLAGLAERSSLSRRFLAEVEAGRANISVVKLHRLAQALASTASELIEEPDAPSMVALLGLRGAGKSTVGPILAERLGIPFVELDALVEEQSGLPLAEVFAVHGESLYRRLEAQALESLLAAGQPLVLATGGGLVSARETYDRLKRSCLTVWLKARPEEHFERVSGQGDLRPIQASADAMAELRQILSARAPLYGEADVTVETSAALPEAVAADVLAELARLGLAA